MARSKNNIIGDANGIPWNIKGEQSQFRELTWGNVVIMGRKTYEDIGHPLPGRTIIVVSNTKVFKGVGLMTARSLSDALALAGTSEVFISGGASIYREALQMGVIDKIYLTTIDIEIYPSKTSVRFPGFNEDNFVLVAEKTVNSCTVAHGQDICEVSYVRQLYVREAPKAEIQKLPTVIHTYIEVDEDSKKKEKFKGSLAELAAVKLNEWRAENAPASRIISISEETGEDEVRLEPNNSSTWYDRKWLTLSVWLER